MSLPSGRFFFGLRGADRIQAFLSAPQKPYFEDAWDIGLSTNTMFVKGTEDDSFMARPGSTVSSRSGSGGK